MLRVKGPIERTVQPGVDQQASWAQKSSQLQYGYKRHYLADAQEGLVLEPLMPMIAST